MTDCRSDLQHSSSARDGVASNHGDTRRSPELAAIDAIAPADAHGETQKSPVPGNVPASHPDAIADGSRGSPTRRTSTHTPRHGTQPLIGDGGPVLERDRTVLAAIVDCKYLSAGQLQTHLLRTSTTSVRRCLARLAGGGWVTSWESWAPVGGRPRYALPTRKALRWALERKRVAALGTPVETLSKTLIRTTRRRPVAFAPRTLPPFFLHQCAANETVLALASAADRVLWMSVWDRPLPKTIGLFVPPQPDAVLVVEHGGSPLFVFLEMDRASEHERAFQQGKSRYAGLAGRPALLREVFGTTAFQTLIVVAATSEHATAHRIATLERVAWRGAFAPFVTVRSFQDVTTSPAATLRALARAVSAR